MPTCACDAFFIIRGGDSVTVWGARKELRVCGRVPYSQRTPYSYGYAYTNASATTVPSTVMRRPYPLLYPGTGHGSRSRGDAVHCEKEPLTQGTLVRGRAQGPGAGQAAKGSPKAQNITGKLYSIALSHCQSHAPRAIDVPFAGSTAGQRRVQIVTELRGRPRTKQPQWPAALHCLESQGLRRAPRTP